jgi:hypothetical protein
MSDTSKRWVGSAVALFAAVGLAATELVDTPNEWAGLDVADFEDADVAAALRAPGYETVVVAANSGLASAGLTASSAEAVATVGTRSLAGAPEMPAELLPVSRLQVDSDGHFALTASTPEFFDTYYRMYPSSSDEVVRGRIVLALLDGLPPRAADEAITALDEWRAARVAAAQAAQ